jgi:uncharacterized protein (TIGR00730 family)
LFLIKPRLPPQIWTHFMKRICVFCGSSPGAKPEYLDSALKLIRELARRNIGLVFGGGNLGLMGAIANEMIAQGGKVTGVIPEHLASKEVAFTELSDLRVVSSMHERKALMVELSDGFIALPGGLGTFEEFLEVLTWAQLGIHHKPCGLLNIEGYYDELIRFLDHAAKEQFIESEHRSLLLVAKEPAKLLEQFNRYQPSRLDKATWAKRMSHRPH